MRFAAHSADLVLVVALSGSLAACATQRVSEASSSASGLEPESVRAVVAAHLSELQPCYEQAIEVRPGAAGKILARWSISPSGLVSEAEIKQAPESLKSAEACVLAFVRGLRFPAHHDNADVEIIYPFYFSENGRLPGEVTPSGSQKRGTP